MKKKHYIRLFLSVACLLLIGAGVWWLRPNPKAIKQIIAEEKYDSTLVVSGDSVKKIALPTVSKVDAKYRITNNSVDGIRLNGNMKETIKKLRHIYNVETSKNGPEETDNIYVIKSGKTPVFSLIENSRGTINDIFIFDSKYVTDEGIKVGTHFATIFREHKNYDMRYGDVYDCVNKIGAGEMLKLNDKLFIHYVSENSPKMMATYDYANGTFRLKSPTPDSRVDAILLSLSIW